MSGLHRSPYSQHCCDTAGVGGSSFLCLQLLCLRLESFPPSVVLLLQHLTLVFLQSWVPCFPLWQPRLLQLLHFPLPLPWFLLLLHWPPPSILLAPTGGKKRGYETSLSQNTRLKSIPPSHLRSYGTYRCSHLPFEGSCKYLCSPPTCAPLPPPLWTSLSYSLTRRTVGLLVSSWWAPHLHTTKNNGRQAGESNTR